jgi:hypothetical protein
MRFGTAINRRKGTRTNSKPAGPQVGIIYLVGGRLLIDSTPLANAGRYGDSATHERDHISYWAELVKGGKVLNIEYEEFPRGRASYNTKTRKFTLLADKHILGNKNRVRKILARMNLPARRTKLNTDSHYRCFRCLKHSR